MKINSREDCGLDKGHNGHSDGRCKICCQTSSQYSNGSAASDADLLLPTPMLPPMPMLAQQLKPSKPIETAGNKAVQKAPNKSLAMKSTNSPSAKPNVGKTQQRSQQRNQNRNANRSFPRTLALERAACISTHVKAPFDPSQHAPMVSYFG